MRRVAIGGGTSLVVIAVLGAVTEVPRQIPVAVRIEFSAPADCSSADDFYDGIRLRTDRIRPATGDEAGLGMFVKLVRTDKQVQGELRVVGDRGETDARQVEGATCDEVVQALSLTAALAIDPEARVSPLPEPAATPPGPPPPKAPACAPCPPPPEPLALPPAPEAVDSGLEIGAGASILQAVSPYTALGISATGRVVWQHQAGGLGGSVGVSFLHLQSDFLGTSEAASVELTGLSLTVCPIRWTAADRLRFEPCATGLGGALTATGRSVTVPETVGRSWWSLGASVRAAGTVAGSLSLELEAGLGLPLIKRRFVTHTPDRLVGQTPTFSAMGTLGLVYGF